MLAEIYYRRADKLNMRLVVFDHTGYYIEIIEVQEYRLSFH